MAASAPLNLTFTLTSKSIKKRNANEKVTVKRNYILCTPLSAGELNLQPNVQKGKKEGRGGEGVGKTSTFTRGCSEGRGLLYSGVAIFT